MNVKLILAIINSDDAHTVIKSLTKEGFKVTRLATTGGFLMAGNVTIILGLPSDKVEGAVSIIKKYSRSRKQVMPAATEVGVGMASSFPLEVSVGGATLFVMDAEQFNL